MFASLDYLNLMNLGFGNEFYSDDCDLEKKKLQNHNG
jgi:hypothetical protein